MRRQLPLSWSVVAILALGCGGVSGPPAPHIIRGGGVADGKISGNLNVYVTDEETRNVISSASVRVGASSDPDACVLLTDSTGLAKFEPMGCPSLTGPVTVTVSATGYGPVTWIGVNGANLTIPIRATNPPPVDSAHVRGTISGWSSLPQPAANHQTLAVINYSQTDTLGDRANDIAQGTRTVTIATVPVTIPANVCVINVAITDCNWQLTTRTGAQAVYALIADQYNNMTPDDDSDDTFTVTGWAIKTGLSFGKDEDASGVTLEMIADADAQTFTATFASLPSGMDYMGAFPAMELGDDGRIPLVSPVLDATHTTTRVPKPTGMLAGIRYSLIAQAQDAQNQPRPSSLAWLHDVNIASTVAVSSWLAPPSSILVNGGTYSFNPAAGATLHGGEIQDATGNRLWSITLFDGSASFTLPGLSPDPLPSGMLQFQASSLSIPGIDLGNFKLDDAKDKIVGIAQDNVPFTR